MNNPREGQDVPADFASVRLPEGAELKEKRTFEYTTTDNRYDIELFIGQDGSHYAIGVPREGKVIVYGSSVVKSPEQALQMVVDKIGREHISGD